MAMFPPEAAVSAVTSTTNRSVTAANNASLLWKYVAVDDLHTRASW